MNAADRTTETASAWQAQREVRDMSLREGDEAMQSRLPIVSTDDPSEMKLYFRFATCWFCVVCRCLLAFDIEPCASVLRWLKVKYCTYYALSLSTYDRKYGLESLASKHFAAVERMPFKGWGARNELYHRR